jgi:LacI family gluconate utilization system Gnt-I transcriptional repressor
MAVAGPAVPKKSKRDMASLADLPRVLPLTLADVAKHAGVSTMTASRALNRPELVNQATREKILESVRALGYVPNLLAGSLASSKSRLVAILLPTISHSLFAGTAQAIMDRLTEAGYQALIGPTGYSPEKEEALLEAVLGRRPDGIVLIGSLHTAASRTRLAGAGIPVVEAWDLSDQPLDMQVGFSHEAVGAQMAGHYVAKGYRRFAVITADDPRGHRRCRALINALAALGIDDVPVQVMPLPSGWELGRDGLRRLLACAMPPHMVICSSDTIALGVLAEAASLGLQVPTELAVVGFGDLSEASYAYPSLSTVSVNAAQMGRQVAEALLGRLANPECNRGLAVDTGFVLLDRQSS